jgi:diamine N-acetyltransferase
MKTAMHLRRLERKDASLMLEWMHDPSVVEHLHANFLSKTMEDCERFIASSLTDENNLHLAIADDSDVYQGTVSLKDIHGGTAEFAITIRASAMGKGVSRAAMKEIIRIAFEEKKLDSVFWCVSPENKRAVRFYDKNGYVRVPHEQLSIRGYGDDLIRSMLWYLVAKDAWLREKKTVPGGID